MRYDHNTILPERAFFSPDGSGRITLEGGGKSSPPPAPDYTAAAQATAAGNLDSARATAAANRVNQITPYGSLTYTPIGLDSYGNEKYQATQSLSPDQQQILDSTESLNQNLLGTANRGLSYANDVLSKPGVDTSQLPSLSGSVSPVSGYSSSVDMSGAPGFASQVNTNGPGFAGPVDSAGLGSQAQKAVYEQQTAMLDPQYQQRESALKTQLANQGIAPGTEAYQNAVGNFQREKDYAYSQARNSAIGQGMQYQNQLFGQGLQNASLQNQAQAGLFGQGLQGANLQNQVQQGLFGQNYQQAALNNATLQDLFNQSLKAGNFGNQARQQAFQETAYNQMQPINLINALRSGTQVTNPTFTSVPQQDNPGGPNYLGAAQAQYGADLGAYNASQAADANFMNGLFGLGAAGIKAGMFSDRRLKTNIKRIGTHATGIGVYSFDYVWGEPSVGVMADEVETVMPDAVSTHSSGYKMVNYALLG